MPRERILRVGMRRDDSGEVRQLFGTEPVRRLLQGGKLAVSAGFPDTHAQTLIDAYISGTLVKVSLAGGENVEAEFKRLQGVHEAWTMCFRTPKTNQWRVFGRFSKRNKFIGITIKSRRDIEVGGYTKLAREMIARWDDIFRKVSPHTGSKVDDYLSNARDLDDDFFAV